MRDPRYDDRRSRSPPRRSPPRYRSRSRGGGSRIPVGAFKVTVECLPDDMDWSELKLLGREYGSSLTFARTYRYKGANCGMLEFKDERDANRAVRELDNRRMQGGRERLRVFLGDMAAEVGYGGSGDRHNGGRDYDRGRDYERGRDYDRGRYDDRYDDRRRSPPPRGRSRSRGDYRRGGDDKDDVITTLFVVGLPVDVREDEVVYDLESYGARRAVLMKRQEDTSAFVRFQALRDMERCMDAINDGKAKVCRRIVRAEIARRNTSF